MLELEHVDLKESEHNPVPISKEITPRSFKVLKIVYMILCYKTLYTLYAIISKSKAMVNCNIYLHIESYESTIYYYT